MDPTPQLTVKSEDEKARYVKRTKLKQSNLKPGAQGTNLCGPMRW